MRKNLLLFTGAGILLLWIDIVLGHAGGSFHHAAMWAPLIVLPLTGAAVLAVMMRDTARNRMIFRQLCFVLVVTGFIGSFFHLSTVIRGLQGTVQLSIILRIMRYPPLLAPLSLSGIGILGLLIDQNSREI